jgi:hypothetical protein
VTLPGSPLIGVVQDPGRGWHPLAADAGDLVTGELVVGEANDLNSSVRLITAAQPSCLIRVDCLPSEETRLLCPGIYW